MKRTGPPRYDITKDGTVLGEPLAVWLARQRIRLNWKQRDGFERLEQRVGKARQHYNGSWHLTAKGVTAIPPQKESGLPTVHMDLERAPRKSQEMVSDES